MVAVDTCGVAGLTGSANGERISVEGNRRAKVFTRVGVGGFDVGLLGPSRSRSSEDIHSAAVWTFGVIGLVAVDAGCVAGLAISTNGEGVSRERDRIAKMVTRVACWRL